MNFVKDAQPFNDVEFKNEQGFSNFTPTQNIRPHSIQWYLKNTKSKNVDHLQRLHLCKKCAILCDLNKMKIVLTTKNNSWIVLTMFWIKYLKKIKQWLNALFHCVKKY